jgi:glutathione S-transferase
VSIIDINEVSEQMLVAQYVVELFGAGHFLSRDDAMRIERWLSMSGSSDELLIVLEDILPRRVDKAREKGKKVFSLSSINKSVEKRLHDRVSMVGRVVNGGVDGR